MADAKYNAQQEVQSLTQLAILYGGRCADCGETDFVLFQIDHIEGGGTQDREGQHGKQWRDKLLRECKELHRRRDGIQLLCANCHAKKLSTTARNVFLTSKRTRTVLGNISAAELDQLVEAGELKPESRTVHKGNPYMFTAKEILHYVFRTDGVSSEQVQERILNLAIDKRKGTNKRRKQATPTTYPQSGP